MSELFYTPGLLLGPFRLLLFGVFIYIVNLLLVRRRSARLGLDYFMVRYPLFVSILILTTLLLTQIDSYDLVVIYIILITVSLLVLLDLNLKRPLLRQLDIIRRRSILYVLLRLERGGGVLTRRNILKRSRQNRSYLHGEQPFDPIVIKWRVVIAVTLAIAAFSSRYYFLSYDSYLLSDIWYSDLYNMKDINREHWFFHSGTMMGNFAIINFYSEITNISDALALSSFGLIENALLAIILFWYTNKLSGSKILPGTVAVLAFIMLPVILPLNIGLMAESKSVFFAFTLLLAYMIYLYRPYTLAVKPQYYFWLSALFCAGIININFFVYIYILPVALLTMTIFHKRVNRKFVLRGWLAYLSVLGLMLSLIFIAGTVSQRDSILFLQSNLFSYNDFTYVPHLIINLDELLIIALFCSVFLAVVYGTIWWIRGRAKVPFQASLLSGYVFIMAYVKPLFMDGDLLNQCAALMMVITLGQFFALPAYLKNVQKSGFIVPPVVQLLVGCGIVLGLYFWQGTGYLDMYDSSNSDSEGILRVYDQMDQELLPFSYAVVNSSNNARLGEDTHYFLNYSDFVNGYLTQDSIYAANRKDDEFMRENPQAVLPHSVFVFSYLNAEEKSASDEYLYYQDEVIATIAALRKRGREVKLFFSSQDLTVYQLVNDPKATKIEDLML